MSIASVTDRVKAVLESHGVPSHKHATELAQALQISYSTTHRKLKLGANWTLEELRAIAQHYSVPLTALTDDATDSGQPAVLLVGGLRVRCRLWVGERVESNGFDSLVATQAEQSWVVSDPHAAPEGAHWTVHRLLVDELESRPRIAVLEDNAALARQLVNHFNDLGYEAISYQTVRALQAALPAQLFVAYVLDWVIGDETVAGLIDVLRSHDATCPIAVLTGRFGSDERVEPEIAAAMKKHRLEFFQKPVSLQFISGSLARELGARAPAAAKPAPPALR